MQTAQIDFTGCSKCYIDRAQPCILKPHVSEIAWDQFCDDIDKVTTPQVRYFKISMFLWSFMALSFGLGAGLTECQKNECDLFEKDGPVYLFYVAFGLIPLWLFVLIIASIHSCRIMPRLTKVVQKAARSHVESGVLFRLEKKHLPHKQYYGLQGTEKMWIEVDIDLEKL